jgi:hypothetical protein
MEEDVLRQLNRLLITTPEYALCVEGVRRRTLAAAAAEIYTLRQRLAQQQPQQRSLDSDLTGVIYGGEQ